jgi:alkanesulfonate monooxygenase SsuD/methylene tetrahydromethanopterin reductase-like flavin-dependent oxidoreductase (luciferase family)
VGLLFYLAAVLLGYGGPGFVIQGGGPRRSPGESLSALEEAITVIRSIWSGERNLRVDGEHYRLAGAHGGPTPAHPIGIWIGAYGPRALALTARVADGWVPSLRGDVGAIADMTRRLEDAAAAAGRDPAQLRRILNVSGRVTDGATGGPLHGPVDQWVDELGELALGYRFDTFLFWNEEDGQLDRFAEEVVPAVRSQLR